MLHPNCAVHYHISRPDLKARMEQDVERWKIYVPHWVMEFDIDHQPVDDETPITAACTEVKFSYWKVILTVYDRYFVKDDAERKLYFIHEMLHAYMGPLHDYMWTLEQKDETPQELVDIGANTEENVVESLTFMIKEIEAAKKVG